MATVPKTYKDRPHGSPSPTAPRLQPRPTAASAARAARNATNRNLSLNPTKSPVRTLGKSRYPSSLMRPIQKTDSKIEIKPPLEKPEHDCEVTEVTNECETKIEPKVENDASNNDTATSEMAVSESATNDTFEISQIPDDNQEIPDDNQEIPDDNQECRKAENECQEQPQLENEPETEKPPQAPSMLPTSPPRSRPQTPKSLQSSRPQTPRSRPVTPRETTQRKTSSRPNTPVKTTTTTTRPKTPTPSAPASKVPVSKHTSRLPKRIEDHDHNDDIKTEYIAKQRQFHRLKKELDLKQQALLGLFDNLRALGERLGQEAKGGGEALPMQELVMFNVGDWTAEEIAQLCRDAMASSDTDNAIKFVNAAKPIDEYALVELDSDIAKVPSHFADLCLQAFSARQELIDWVKELLGKIEDGDAEYLERIASYNSQGIQLCEALRQLKTRTEEVMDTVSQISRRACQERGTLISVGESLVREIARLRHDLEARAVIVNEMREIRAENDTAKLLEETRHELEEERAVSRATKDKLSTTETHLKQSRVRVAKMDRQLREAEASISSLTGTVKSLEDQSRQREVQLEARARKLRETVKTGEVTSQQISQQRDALLAEVQSLKEQIKNLQQMSEQNKNKPIESNTQEVKELKALLEQQQHEIEKERELRQQTENRLRESEAITEELKIKNTEYDSNRPNPELPTEREMDLWAELQATKDTLRMMEEEVTLCKREKTRFLETLTKISETEKKVGMQQKLAAELLSKEEIVSKMQIQIRELTKNVRLNEKKLTQYEQYVRDLQAHTRAVANCRESPNGISYQDLQQEVMNLRMSLLESVHRNEELSEVLAQKEQQLENQDKTSRAQARVIKVREELINMLKNKETEQGRELNALQQDLEHRMKIVDEVNTQIAAKAQEIEELFTTLESKQQQIHRLEKIVLALEEQQRRAQAQRTRYEEKIAALEHELAAGNRRERKFLFF